MALQQYGPPSPKPLDPHINPKTGVWDDNFYAQQQQANGGGSSSDPAQALQDEITKEYKAQQDQYTKGLSDYNAKNPFNFDDMLTKATATAKGNISPYYDQLLGNYLQGVSIQKGDNLASEQKFLTKSQADLDAFTGNARAMLDNTLTSVGQEYGNAGSYDSGARARAQGQQTAQEQYNEQQQQRNTGYAQQQAVQQYGAQTANINLASTAQQQQYKNTEAGDVYNQAQQLATQAQQAHNYLAQQYAVGKVTSQGPQSSAGVVPGMSSPQTQQFIQSMLPSVQVQQYGGASPAPMISYQ
jgi:hypothetical protein